MTDLDALEAGAGAFGLRLDERQLYRFRTYLAGLAEWNHRLSLTSPAALADAQRVHLLDSLTLVPLLTRGTSGGKRLVDVGSGAGFPGLALKVAVPELDVVLVEATRKKAEFLRWMTARMELDGVEVLSERAEVAGHDPKYRESFDVATARALGPLPVVLELALPLCGVGGVLLAQRGADGKVEAEASARAVTELGGEIMEVATPGVGTGEGRFIVVIAKAHATPDRYPRRTGIPAKRPLR